MPKGEYATPGPFYEENGYLLRRSTPSSVDMWPCLGGMNWTERNILVGLLNKGTHFEGLVKALRAVLNSPEGELNDYEAGVSLAAEDLACIALRQAGLPMKDGDGDALPELGKENTE